MPRNFAASSTSPGKNHPGLLVQALTQRSHEQPDDFIASPLTSQYQKAFTRGSTIKRNPSKNVPNGKYMSLTSTSTGIDGTLDDGPGIASERRIE